MNDVVLQSSELQVKLARPGERYRGIRFDGTSQLYSVVMDGHEFLTSEKAPGTGPEGQGWGLAAEFGITKAWGYGTALPGSWFPKIGVGSLRRNRLFAPYQFWIPYTVRPAEFHVKADATTATMTAQSAHPSTRAWRLSRVWSVNDNELHLETTLENRGRKRMVIEEYHHNFLSFDHSPAVGWTLDVPEWRGLQGVDKLVDSAHVWRFENSILTWTRPAVGDVFFADSRLPAPRSWTLRDATRKLSVRETLHAPAKRFHLWGTDRVASPEVFTEIRLDPGQQTQWKRTWTFEVLP